MLGEGEGVEGRVVVGDGGPVRHTEIDDSGLKNLLFWGLQVPTANLVHEGEDMKMRMMGIA